MKTFKLLIMILLAYSASFSQTFTTTITSSVSSPTKISPFVDTITFGDTVTKFKTDYITVTNGTKGALTNFKDSMIFTLSITPDSEGAVIASIAAGVCQNDDKDATNAAGSLSITYDASAPIINSVSSTTSNGSYNTADPAVDVSVTFSENVTTAGTGSASITLNSGGTATYSTEGSGSSILNFIYTIGGSNNSADLDYNATNSLTLSSFTIQDAAGNNATLTLPAVGGASSLGGQKNIKIDNTKPTVVLSKNHADAVVRNADDVLITATFTEADAISEITKPKISIGTLVIDATMEETTNLVWTYEWDVPAGNNGVQNISISALDSAGNVNTAATGVTSLTIDNIVPSGYSVSIDSAIINKQDTTIFSFTFTGAETGTTCNYTISSSGGGTPVTGSGTISSATQIFQDIHVTGLGDGTLTLSVTLTDVAGNTGTAATDHVTKDVLVPAKPVLTGIADDTGTSSSDELTSDQTLVFNGTTETGATIEVFIDGSSVGTTLADGVGSWSYDYTGTSLAADTYALTTQATDTAGNVGNLSDPLPVIVDYVPPTVIVSSDHPDAVVRNPETVILTATFAEDNGIDEVTKPRISIGSVVSNAVMVSTTNLVWTYEWDVPAGNNGAQDISISALDSAGNANTAATGVTSLTIDNISPTVSNVTSSSANGSYKAGVVIPITVTFSENVNITSTPQLVLETGTTNDTVDYTSGNGSSNLIFNYSVQADDSSLDLDYVSNKSLLLNGGTIKDIAGNDADTTLAIPAAQYSLGYNKDIIIDNTAPYVSTITRVDETPTTDATMSYTVTFSESVNNVDISDFTLTKTSTADGTISSVSSASGTTITVNLTGVSGDGTLRLDLKNSGTGITDNATNPISGGFTAGQVYTIDNTAPYVSTITRVDETPTTDATMAYTVTFSESVLNVDVADFTLTKTSTADGTISSVSSASGTTITVNLTGVTGNGTLRLDLNGSGTGITDDATNPIPGGFTTGQVYTIDNTAPFVSTITRVDETPTTDATMAYSVTFGESVLNVDVADFTLTPTGTATGTVSSVSSSSGTTITVNLTGVAGDGTLRLDLKASGTGITDDATNPISGGFTTGEVYTIDNTTLKPLFTEPAAGISAGPKILLDFTLPERAKSNTVKVTFKNGSPNDDSDPHVLTFNSNFESAKNHTTYIVGTDLSTTDSLASNSNGGAGKDYLNNGSVYDVTLEYQDLLGNTVVDSTHSSFTYTSSPLTATITKISPDPRNTQVTSVSITLSKYVNVTRVAINDFIFKRNGSTVTLPAGAVSYSNPWYDGPTTRSKNFSVALGSYSGPEGNYEFWIVNDNGDICDKYGNYLIADSSDTWVMDLTDPVINSLTTTETSPTKTYDIPVTVVFSETVSKFTVGDITVVNGTAKTLTTADSTTFTFYINPLTLYDTLRVSLAADVCQDAATNGNTASGTLTIVSDRTPPGVTISSVLNPTNDNPIPFTVQFTEDVTGFTQGDMSITGFGTISDFSGSGDLYTFNFNPSTDGVITVNIAAGGCIDAAANSNTAAPEFTITSDRTAPALNAVTIASDNVHPSYVGVDGTVTITMTGSENIDIISATIDGNAADSIRGSGKNWSAYYTMKMVDSPGVIPFEINYNDLAGNAGAPVTSTTNSSSVTFDKTAPKLIDVSIESNNSINPGRAIAGNIVTLSFTADEVIESVNAKVNNKTATTSTSDNINWTAEYTVSGTDADGILPFTVNFKDYAGNIAAQHDTTTDYSSVTVDNTKPTLDSVVIKSNHTDIKKASTGNVITLFFRSVEPITITAATTTIAGQIVTPTSVDNMNWSAIYTMTGTDAEGVIPFAINFKDLTGNVGNQVTAITDGDNVSFDRTKPTLSNVLISSDNPNSALAKTGNTVTINFYASETIIVDSVKIEGNIGVVSLISGNSWKATHLLSGSEPDGKVDFTIYYKDTYGNYGDQVTSTSNGGKVTIDNIIPILNPVSISSDNDSTLLAMVGDMVTLSFTSSEGIKGVTTTIGTRTVNASSNAAGTIWTVPCVMQSTDNPEGYLSISIIFSDSTGNEGAEVTATSLGERVRFDKSKPTLSNVSIVSNNANPTKAIVGNVVTLSFTSSEGLIITDPAQIGGHNATMNSDASGISWSATYTMDSDDNEGIQGISITFRDSTGNLGTTVTTTGDGSSVIFDRSLPTLISTTIVSNNPNTTMAKTGDLITLSFGSSETIQIDSVWIAGSESDSVKNISGNTWKAYYTVKGSETEDIVAFTIDYKDLFNNEGAQMNTTSNGSSVTIDNSFPLLSYVNIASSNSENTRAKAGDNITLSFTSNEGIKGVTSKIGGKTASVAGDATGTSWNASYTMLSTDNEGILPILIAFSDSTNNTDTVEAVTNTSFVRFDRTYPVLDTVRIYSNGLDSAHAKAGDDLTVKFYSSEGLKQSDLTVKIGGIDATLNSEDVNGKVWTASREMLSTDFEGVVSLSISFKDSTGNQPANVTSKNKGSNVTFDRTTPMLYTVEIASNNSNSGRAVTGDIVTLTFTASETLLPLILSDVTFETNPATSITSTGGNTWEVTYLISGSEADGNLDFAINFQDIAFNMGSVVTTTTNNSTITIDNTTPSLTAINITSSNVTNTLAKVDDIVTLTFTAAEAIQDVKIHIDTSLVSDIYSNSAKTSWTATYTMQADDEEGYIPVVIDFEDIAGNQEDSTRTTSLKFDRTAPTLPTVSMVSSNAVDTLAKVGDMITLNFTSSEGIRNVTALINNTRTVTLGAPGDNGKLWTGTYIMQSSDADGELSISIDFRDSTGNAGVTVTDVNVGYPVIFDRTKPTLTTVSIASENDNTELAKVGDDVTLSFISSEGILVTNVTICGTSVTPYPSTNTNWTATYTMQVGDAQGVIPFSIAFRDTVGNIGNSVTTTTDYSTVTFDNTPPTLPLVTIASNYTNTNKAKNGSTITVNFTSSETILNNVTASILDQPATVTNITGNNWRATYTPVVGSTTEAEGVVPFTINFTDNSGNTSSVSATTDGSKVIYDRTLPDLNSINIVSDHTNTDRARVGSEITLSFTSSEPIDSVYTQINGIAAVIDNPTGNSWTATRYMKSTDSDGILNFTIAYRDSSGNAGVLETSTDNGSSVTFDKVKPVYDTVYIYSNNSIDTTLAVAGDLIILEFTTNEAIETPEVTINGIDVTDITGGPTVWVAKRQIASGENEGVVPFTINIADLAGNIPNTQYATDNGSSVTFDDSEPGISTVTVTAGIYKVGDVIPVLIKTDDDSYVGTTVEVNGMPQTLINNNNNNYTVDYTVGEGDIEIVSSGGLPVNIVLQDAAGLTTSRTIANSLGGTITVDTHTPIIDTLIISTVGTKDGKASVKDQIIFTLVKTGLPEEGLTITPTKYNSVDITWETKDGGATYTATYTVEEGQTTPSSILQLGNVTLTDAAGNKDTYLQSEYSPVDVHIYTKKPTVQITVSKPEKCIDDNPENIFFKFTGTAPYNLYYAINSNHYNVAVSTNSYTLSQVFNESVSISIDSLVDATTNSIDTALTTASIAINQLPIVSFNITNPNYSKTSKEVKLNPFVDIDGGVFSGTAVGAIGLDYYFYPSIVPADSLDNDLTIIYTYTDINGCTSKTSGNVYVSSKEVKIINLESTYCSYDGTATISGVKPDGWSGVFSVLYNGTGLAVDPSWWEQNDSVTMEFNPMLFSAGNYKIRYEATNNLDALQKSSDEQFFKIEAPVVGITITGLLSEYCYDKTASNIEIGLKGVTTETGSLGTFTATSSEVFSTVAGLHSATFIREKAQASQTYTISYYYTSPNGCISELVDTSIYIKPLPEITFSLQDNYNYDGELISLNGTPVSEENGIYTYLTTTTTQTSIDPKTLSLSTEIPITYTYTDENKCTSSKTDTTIIYDAKETISGLKPEYCYKDSSFTISCIPIVDAAIVGSFSSRKYAITPTGDNTAQYNLKTAGDGRDTVTFSYSINGTPYWINQTVDIDSIGNISITGLNSSRSYCFSDNEIVNVTGSTDRSIAGYGTLNYSGSTSAYTKTGSSKLDYYISSEIVGIYTFTYTFVSQVTTLGCSSTMTQDVTINPLPDVSFDLPGSYFYNHEPITLKGEFVQGKFSGRGITNDSIFTPSYELLGTVDITHTYTIEETGCAKSLTKSTEIVETDATFNGITNGQSICFNANPITLTATGSDITTAGAFHIISSTADSTLETTGNVALFNPAGFDGGDYTVKFSFRNATGTDMFVSKTFNIVKLDDVTIVVSDIDENNNFCKDITKVLLIGSPQEGGVFSGDGIAGTYFYPGIVDPGKHTITYTSSKSGCSVNGTVDLIVNPLPVVHFSVDVPCSDLISEPIHFTNKTTCSDPITEWAWTFAGVGTSNEISPSYMFTTSGNQKITLSVTTSAGCSSKLDTVINVGVIPKANFRIENDCFISGETTTLIDSTSEGNGLSITNFKWLYNNEVIGTNQVVEYEFPGNGVYDVSLIVTSNNNCIDTITKKVTIQPLIPVAADNSYSQTFEGEIDWLAKGITESDSCRWSVCQPNGDYIKPESKVWYSYMKVVQSTSEQTEDYSQVVSPCFDFSGLSKPMIKMNIWPSLNNSEGAVLEYSTDGGIVWRVLGTTGEGINWYNSSSIQLLSNEGFTGWTGNKVQWDNVRHNLDNLAGERKARFRVVYSAQNKLQSGLFDGFAFDNVWIGERQQLQLLEYFTNPDVPISNNNYIHELEISDSLDLVPIHYLTSGTLYNDYTTGPSSRIFYYGMPNAPYAYSNGTITYNFESANTATFENNLDIESLKDPEISISLSGVTNGANITLSIDTSNHAIESEELVVQCAIVKKEISGHYNVIRRFIPDPGGTPVSSGSWAENGGKKNQTINLSWTPTSTDLENVLGVVFVQNLQTNKVYQTVRFSPSIFTGVHPIDISSLVDIYPNPTSGILVIECGYNIETIQIFDITGRIVLTTTPIQQQVALPVEQLKGGIYILRGKTNQGEFVKKFVKN